jgi:hypothetical protein
VSFAVPASPRQRSHSQVLVPWDSRPYFTVSNSRLLFLSLPTNRRVTDKVFHPVCTRDTLESEIYVTTDGQSAVLSINIAPTWGLRPDFYYCQTVLGLLMWDALSDERTGRVCR